MRRLFFICVALTLLLQALSCSLNEDAPNFRFEPLQITNAELPDSFELKKTYQITVNFTIPDSCTGFSGFDATQSDTSTRNVVVFGIVRTDQKACITTAKEAQASFSFVCLYDKPYTFRFWQGEGEDGEQEYFEVVVPVN